MPNTVVSPNMNITVPVVLTDPGPDWASRIYTALFTTIDQHDHSGGKGLQVTPAGLNINADLAFGSFNATALRSSRFTSQASPLALGSDVGALYVSAGELWYNDLASRQVQLTLLGAVNSPTLYYPLKTPVSGNYTILSTDKFSLYYVDVTGGVATINLPSAAAMTPGRVFFFVDFKRNAATNNISIVRNGADLINGGAGNYVIATTGSYAVITTDGVSNWYANTIGPPSLTAFGADLAGSTAVSQWVAAISGPGGVSGAVAVNGASTTLNWVTNGITLQQAGTTLLSLKAGAVDFIALGVNPASAGLLRVASGGTGFLKSRNNGNTADLTLLGTDASDNLAIGGGVVNSVLLEPKATGTVSFRDNTTEYANFAQVSSVATLTVAQTASGLLVTQAQQGNASNPQSMTFTPQAPGAGAASTATGTAGNVIVNVAAPVSTGTEAYFVFQRAGANNVILGDRGNTQAGIWIGPGVATLGTTWALLGDGSSLHVNAISGNIYFEVAGTVYHTFQAGGAQFNSASLSFGGGSGVLGIGQVTTVPTSASTNGLTLWANTGSPGSLGIFSTGISFHRLSAAPAIAQDTCTTDVVAAAGSHAAQSAWASAVTNPNGGALTLKGGASANATAGASLIMGGATNATSAIGTAQLASSATGGQGNIPWAWSSSTQAITTGTFTLSAAQIATPVIILSGTLSGACTLVFPNKPGFWLLDVSALVMGAFTLTLQSGSGNSFAFTATQIGSTLTHPTLMTVVTLGANAPPRTSL